MNDNDAIKAYLDALAEELKADYPGDGEYTVSSYIVEMRKRNLTLSVTSASRILAELVANEKWTVRQGQSTGGRSVKIYKPILNKKAPD